MTRMIRRFLCLALAAVMMAALLPFAVSGTTAKAASSTGIVTLEGVNFRVGPSMKDKVLFKISKVISGVIVSVCFRKENPATAGTLPPW